MVIILEERKAQKIREAQKIKEQMEKGKEMTGCEVQKQKTTTGSKQKASHRSNRAVCPACDGVYEEERGDGSVQVECIV